MQTAACLWAALLWLGVAGQSAGGALPVLTLTRWVWAGLSGLVYYGLAFWLNSVGLQKTPATVASLFLNLVPIFTVGAGYLFLGEQLAPLQCGGAALIMTAVTGLLVLSKA